MNVFVFKPTNESIGKFKVKSLDEIEAATRNFILPLDDVPDLSYVEAGNATWTIARTDPFTLLVGRLGKGDEAIQKLDEEDFLVQSAKEERQAQASAEAQERQAQASAEAQERHYNALLEKCLASGQDERGLSSLSWKDLQEVVDLSRSFLNHSFSPTSQKQEDDVYELVKMVLRDATASRMLEVSTLLKIEAQTSQVGAKIEGLTGAAQNIGSTAKTATRTGMLAASLGIQKMDEIIDGIEGD